MASRTAIFAAKHGALLSFVLVFALTYVVVGGIAVVSWWPRARTAYSGLTTHGRITAKEPKNHQIIRYDYSVGPKQFSGAQIAGIVGIPFQQISIGDPVSVTYDAGNPAISLPGDPRSFLRWCYAVLFLWLPLICTLFAAWATYRYYRPRRSLMQRAAI